MMIDKISGVNPLTSLTNTKRTSTTQSVKVSSDEITLSDEAKAMAEARMISQMFVPSLLNRSSRKFRIRTILTKPQLLQQQTEFSAHTDSNFVALGIHGKRRAEFNFPLFFFAYFA